MRAFYILLAVVAVVAYNGMLIQRDQKLFEAYDQACAAQPSNPNCIYAK